MYSTRLFAALAGTTMLAAACGGSTGQSASPATQPPASSAASSTVAPAPAGAEGGVVAVPEALQFTAPLVGGGELDAATLAGRPTVFWFWAPT